MRDNNKIKGQKREDTKRNQGKMIVRGRSIFTIMLIKEKRVNKKLM